MVNELQEDNCSSISVQNNSLQASRTSYRTPEYRGSIPKKTRLKKKKSYQLRLPQSKDFLSAEISNPFSLLHTYVGNLYIKTILCFLSSIKDKRLSLNTLIYIWVCITLKCITSIRESHLYFVFEMMMRNYNIITLHALLVFSFIAGFNSIKEKGDTKCKVSERQALLTFKQGIQDDYGMLSTSKDGPNADCCKWEGVQCNNQTGYMFRICMLRHLKYLDLSHLITNDQIPKFIGSFSNLRYLDLSVGGYGGKIPTQLGNLSQLRHLDLSNNGLTGQSFSSES
ncbi:LRR amino-terminal domain protein [Medicago truncatula]|uniref:LRR amino-terminal domain protein n=1 Tax=Medicago truncatula TaxID=3880 RepID=G7ID24_MEDTR|nr:LRR amino-terminal domain protein [Medicago truncatula]